MADLVVTIKPICATDWTPLRTEVFVRYEGHSYYSRLNYMLSDTPHERARLAQEFLRRLKAHPSITQQKENLNGIGILDNRRGLTGLHRHSRVAEAQPAEAHDLAGRAAGDTTRSLETYEETQSRVTTALNSDLLDFAKTAEPKVPRPAFKVVR